MLLSCSEAAGVPKRTEDRGKRPRMGGNIMLMNLSHSFQKLWKSYSPETKQRCLMRVMSTVWLPFFLFKQTQGLRRSFKWKRTNFALFFKDGNDGRRFFFLVNVAETASTGASKGNAQPHKWSTVCKLVQAGCSSWTLLASYTKQRPRICLDTNISHFFH